MNDDQQGLPPKLREPDPPDAPPPAGPTPTPARAKSRTVGCCLIAGGGVMLALSPALGLMSQKLFGVLLGFGSAGLMVGAGMLAVPWTDEMFAMNDQDDLGKWWGSMTGFWKVWFPLSIVVMLAVTLAGLILT